MASKRNDRLSLRVTEQADGSVWLLTSICEEPVFELLSLEFEVDEEVPCETEVVYTTTSQLRIHPLEWFARFAEWVSTF